MAANSCRITLRGDQTGGTISRHLCGHFAEHLGRCIYGGIWVGPDSTIPNINGYRKDIVDALRAIRIPNLRWPGGCFADDYHWRDGIGPRSARPKTVNIHWGNYVEDNSFGTHEFLDLCELLGCDPYIACNVGSSTPAEMRQWIEYITFDGASSLAEERRRNGRQKPWKLPFVGIGNENWGCGGQMTPEFYTDLHNQFRIFARPFSQNSFTRIACGPNVEDYRWAEVLLERGRGVQGVSWHMYSHWPDWPNKGPALADDPESWHGMLTSAARLDAILTRADEIFDRKDPDNKIGIYFDEWGTWHRTEPGDTALYQQNTIRDALVAALSLDILHKHGRRVRMANIAQTVNVLHAMILTETGGKNRMLRTPTYHVFDMFKVHHDATMIPIEIESPQYTMADRKLSQVSASASADGEGYFHLSLSNLHHEAAIDVSCGTRGSDISSVHGRILTAPSLNAHNTFDEPDRVVPTGFDGAKLRSGELSLQLPPRSVVVLKLSRV